MNGFGSSMDVSVQVEALNGHALQADEMLNIDETGFDLCNNAKTMRVIIRYKNYATISLLVSNFCSQNYKV